MSWKLPRLSKQTGLIFCGILFLLLSITTLLMTSKMSSEPIRADGEGYYLYLPAVFIHHDLTMRWTEPMRQADMAGLTGDWHGLTPFKAGTYLNKYPVGLAILWTPFFLVAHVLSKLTGQPITGFSMWYQVAINVASAVYTGLGCAMLYKLLRRHFSIKVSYFTTLTLLLGTNMLSYATYDSSFTHVYSFFLIATLLYLTPLWYKNMTYRTSLLLAVVFALNVLVRQTNILLLLVVVLWNVTTWAQLRQRFLLFWNQWRKVAAMAGAMLLVCSPQLLYWHHITGRWLIFSYRGESFNFLHPQLLNILFSTDRGVFFWAPVLLLSMVGLGMLRRYLKEWSTSLYVFLPVWLWIIASWHSWQFGESYGHRAFIDVFPLLGLALAVVYSRAQSVIVKNALRLVVSLFIIANLFLTYQYWIGGLPDAETTMSIYLKVWLYGLSSLVNNGLTFGFFGLIGIVSVTIGPLTHYMLVAKDLKNAAKHPTA